MGAGGANGVENQGRRKRALDRSSAPSAFSEDSDSNPTQHSTVSNRESNRGSNVTEKTTSRLFQLESFSKNIHRPNESDLR